MNEVTIGKIRIGNGNPLSKAKVTGLRMCMKVWLTTDADQRLVRPFPLPAQTVPSGLFQQDFHALLAFEEALRLQSTPGEVEQGVAAVALLQMIEGRPQVRQRLLRGGR